MVALSGAEFAFGILVNVVSALLIFMVAWVVLYVSRHRHIVEFFNARGRGITLYTSTLNVSQFGSTDARGAKRSFSGPAIPLAEARLIAEFEAMLSTYAFGRLEVLRWLRIVGLDYRTESSPATVDLVDRSRTLLTLGSPGYNTASQLVEEDFEPLGKFDTSNSRVAVAAAETPTTVNSGMVLRAVHPQTGQVVFYAAGPSEMATVEAAKYLLQNWASLRKEYGSTRPFCIVVEASKGGSTVIHRSPTAAVTR